MVFQDSRKNWSVVTLVHATDGDSKLEVVELFEAY
jgi:hypothetical protein